MPAAMLAEPGKDRRPWKFGGMRSSLSLAFGSAGA
jgi:hypothetical protein